MQGAGSRSVCAGACAVQKAARASVLYCIPVVMALVASGTACMTLWGVTCNGPGGSHSGGRVHVCLYSQQRLMHQGVGHSEGHGTRSIVKPLFIWTNTYSPAHSPSLSTSSMIFPILRCSVSVVLWSCLDIPQRGCGLRGSRIKFKPLDLRMRLNDIHYVQMQTMLPSAIAKEKAFVQRGSVFRVPSTLISSPRRLLHLAR